MELLQLNCKRLFFSLHGTVFSAGPSSLQSFPPLDGGGLVQVLVSVFTPPPHVTLHFDSDQSVYPPSTAVQWEKKDQPLVNENGHFSEHCNTRILPSACMMTTFSKIRKNRKLLLKKTYIIFVRYTELSFCWPKQSAVLSTVRCRGIGAGSCKCLHSSSTLHTALRLRPISVSPVHSFDEEK